MLRLPRCVAACGCGRQPQLLQARCLPSSRPASTLAHPARGASCRAAQSTPHASTDSDPQQQLQPPKKKKGPRSRAQQQEEHHYDMNFFHYMPWWMQPLTVVGAGLAFMLAAMVMDDQPSMKTCAIAAGPVALFWGILLFLLPQQFQKFAATYLKEHPHDSSNEPQ